MKPVVVIRPQPGFDATIAAVRALRIEVYGFPLFEVHPRQWEPPDPSTIDALLIGSANAVRHGSTGLWALRGKPVYAVGARTAEAAAAAGFDVVAAGTGGLQEMMGRLHPDHRRLLRPAGRQRVALIPPEGVTIIERMVYSSDPLPMPAALAELLRKPAVVMLHSREAAAHFVAECAAHGMDRSVMALAAIGPRVIEGIADAADGGWDRVEVAQTPDEAALLALTAKMCEEPTGLENTGSMEADAKEPWPGAAALSPPLRRRSARGVLAVAILAFILGACAVAWTASRGYLDRFLPRAATMAPVANMPDGPRISASAADTTAGLDAVGSVEARLAMLEDRLSRLNLQAESASHNATRAESLLIAFATRRMIDRGEPLRYLGDQLRLRFSDGQPRAVSTIIEFSRDPVTLDQLSARLEALAPDLTQRSSNESIWIRASRELSGLFVVRREASASMSSEARLDNARVMLTAGRIEEAIDRVGRMPGADAAVKWIADARRYAAVQNALDLIETAAMLQSGPAHETVSDPAVGAAKPAAASASVQGTPEQVTSPN